MSTPYSPPPYPYQPPRPPSGGRGNCFFKGCLVVIVVLMVIGIAIGGVGWYIYRSAQPFLTHAPVAIRTAADPDAQYAGAAQKLAAFNQTVAAGHPAVLTLTADDLNGLVARDPQFSDLRGRLFLSIVNNQLVAETSFPLSNDPSLREDQRLFFDARFVLNASYASGDFAFQLVRFEALDGKQPPGGLMTFVQSYLTAITQGFNRSFHEHPERQDNDLRRLSEEVKTIIIKDNAVVATSVDHPRPAATPVAETPQGQ